MQQFLCTKSLPPFPSLIKQSIFSNRLNTLDNAIADRIKTYYTTFIGNNGNTKDVIIINGQHIFDKTTRTYFDGSLPSVQVTLSDIQLRVRYQRGDTVQRDCMYESSYMSTAMRLVGKAM